jgi:predicted helicase
MKNFGKSTKQEDPVVHFYETFLGEYNPALRKARGVWYTPQPVVNFIVRAVDDILKTEFNLKDGLADTSKIKIKKTAVTQTGIGANSKIKDVETDIEVHKVQILDPATGTGTFLAEVVKHIHKKFEGQQGIWSKYVTNDLIPRLNGFELLMASYAMAHLKMDMLLTETGYKPTDDQRFRIFLTNSLEEAHPDTQTLFSSWLSDEADQANAIKRDAPVMVVIGNPPYSVSSSNKSKWIESLTANYKKDLNEKNIQPLSDDYIKFIRFGQHFIDKNGSGILAYISNNSFIDGIIHRQMRKHLLESFDKIYILDLHGNSKKKEVCPDGSVDQNVFDIMQGVSINIFVKTYKKKQNELGEVFHYDLQGKRDFKYNFLNQNLKDLHWNNLNYDKQNYFFVKKDFKDVKDYELGFKITELMPVFNSGIETGRDDFFIDFEKKTLIDKLIDVFNNKEDENKIKEYSIKDTTSFRLKSNLKKSNFDENLVHNIIYRPFDYRYNYYDKNLQRRPSFETLKHVLKNNVCLVTSRQFGGGLHQILYITDTLIERSSQPLAPYKVFPLYLYSETTTQTSLLNKVVRTPNLNMQIVNEISNKLGIPFVAEKEGNSAMKNFAPIDLLDYIYAVLHSPTYREKYKEFLKIDFPRVPFPKDQKTFFKLVKLGSQLREIHLLESPIVDKYITQYPEDGNNIVTKPIYKNGNVYINETQYFANVPIVAWEFYIGGYQPAQKWLKDRKDRELSYEDILHYQKIIVALSETDRLMKEIDTINL